MCPIDPAACMVLAVRDESPALTGPEWQQVTEAQLVAIAAMLALAAMGVLLFGA